MQRETSRQWTWLSLWESCQSRKALTERAQDVKTLSVTAYAVPAPPKGGALGYTGNFAATAKGVPLGELAANAVSRLRGYKDFSFCIEMCF